MYELLVVGDDPAGLATARCAASRGMAVALACEDVDGLQSGPFLSAALRELVPELAVDVLRGGVYHELASSGRLTPRELRDLVIGRVEDACHASMRELRVAGVDLHVGTPRFLSERSVEVVGEDSATVLEAHAIAVATGTMFAADYRLPQIDDFVLTADQILLADRIPGRLVVVGADPAGIEFAGLFAVSGTQVTIVDGGLVLRDDEDGQLDTLIDVAMALGVGFRLGADVVGVDLTRRASREMLSVQLDSGDHLLADMALVAGRRVGRTVGLNLSVAGLVADDTHRLWCDYQQRTWQPTVFGVGDVVGFAPRRLSAAEQAEVVVDAIRNPRRVPPPLGLRSTGSSSTRLRVLPQNREIAEH